MPDIILLNKPYRVLCQFSQPDDRLTLAHLLADASLPDFYPAGRLDHDSEGLVILTDNGALQHRISHPKAKLEKVYWVQVEGTPNADSLDRLRQGIKLKDGLTRPAYATLMDAPKIWTRDPPIRVRQKQDTAWLALTLREGRNRQVRRMTAAVGHPTLRLIRAGIGPWRLDTLQPGEYRRERVHLPKDSNR